MDPHETLLAECENQRVEAFLEEHAKMFYDGRGFAMSRDKFKLAVRGLLQKHNLIFA